MKQRTLKKTINATIDIEVPVTINTEGMDVSVDADYSHIDRLTELLTEIGTLSGITIVTEEA